AGPDDLLIVVKGASEAAANEALEQVDALLARRPSSGDHKFRPRSLSAAVRQLPQANWVLVSVPGRFATGVAREALEHGRHVFLYSDNVSLEDELALKETARKKALLVMGPDCGTAVINGVGLGFANRLRRGPVGLVGASGTGLQAVTSRIDSLGSGVSHALGTGGRDLKSEIGGITARQALDLLGRDPQTEVIVLVSKPPASEVAAALLRQAAAARKPIVIDFIGYPPPGRRLGNLHFAAGLEDAADLAVSLLSSRAEQAPASEPASGYLRGLFSGGTLAYEALLALQAMLGPVFSNAPITVEQKLSDPFHSREHTIVDLGGDEFTVGRLHPMMDNDLRIRRMRQEAADPQTGVILLDVVLGEGSHPDPAAELAPAISSLRGSSRAEFVILLVGTEADPQGLASQEERLTAAGGVVFRSLSDAAAYVSGRLARGAADTFPPVPLDALEQPVAAINVGLETFHQSLLSQGAQALQLDWRPPAGGDERLASLLQRMKK
ncbi:MAG TPA: acyl-CoA synthetase FdrA, partial [Anaerolineales bacterium]